MPAVGFVGVTEQICVGGGHLNLGPGSLKGRIRFVLNKSVFPVLSRRTGDVTVICEWIVKFEMIVMDNLRLTFLWES